MHDASCAAVIRQCDENRGCLRLPGREINAVQMPTVTPTGCLSTKLACFFFFSLSFSPTFSVIFAHFASSVKRNIRKSMTLRKDRYSLVAFLRRLFDQPQSVGKISKRKLETQHRLRKVIILSDLILIIFTLSLCTRIVHKSRFAGVVITERNISNNKRPCIVQATQWSRMRTNKLVNICSKDR